MNLDPSPRNVRRLAREYGMPEGAVREMIGLEGGTWHGDVTDGSPPRPGHRSLVRRVAGLVSLLIGSWSLFRRPGR